MKEEELRFTFLYRYVQTIYLRRVVALDLRLFNQIMPAAIDPVIKNQVVNQWLSGTSRSYRIDSYKS
jgi:hypothetical protein